MKLYFYDIRILRWDDYVWDETVVCYVVFFAVLIWNPIHVLTDKR